MSELEELMFMLPSWSIPRGWVKINDKGEYEITRKGREWIAKQK